MGRYLDMARKVSTSKTMVSSVTHESYKREAPGIKISHRPYAAKIYSKILNDTVWVVTHISAISFIPEGEIYYLPEEIRGLRGATPEDIQAIHKVKKELGGHLVSVKGRIS